MPKYEIDECLQGIKECLEVGWTGTGFKTEQFENEWKKYTGFPNAFFTNSSTIGLNMAIDILKDEYGWKNNDEIITTPITFVSTNHAILKSNLKPVFADIDDTMCMTPESVLARLTKDTIAVMYVGMGGNIGHYYEIVEICKKYKLKLILDAAHMVGTRYNGKMPGKEADVVIYSFQTVKNLPTADAGMVCFKRKDLDSIVRKKAWLGINKDTYSRLNGGNYKWKYDVEYVGEKGCGNSIMAAIALTQLKYVDRDNEYRRQLCKWYKEGLECCHDKVNFVKIEPECESACHLFQICVDNRDELIQTLNEKNIFPGVHYISNTNYSMYKYAQGTCPYADYVSEHTLSLPLHMNLTYDDVQHVCNVIKSFLDM